MDFSTGEETVIGQTYPDIPSEYVVEKESFNFKAADGLEIQAYVTYPPRKAKKIFRLCSMCMEDQLRVTP